MTDSHAQLEAWLVDGAMGDPPREIAVHATLCESCTARLGAFDALALSDVAAAGSPPLLAAPTRLRKGVAWARLATVVVGTVVAGILVVFGVSQLVGLGGPAGGPAGGPEGTELAGLSNPSGGVSAQSRQESGGDSTPAEAPTPAGFETPLAGVTPGPLPSVPPGATPRPTPLPTPQPSVGATPTPTPPDPTPTPPAPTATPTPATVPGAPSLTASAATGPVELLWAVPPDGGDPITGYNIYRSLDGSAWALLQPGWAGTAYTDSAVAPATPYWYYVTALNGSGESGPSNIESVTTP